jgi:hypothetical protein
MGNKESIFIVWGANSKLAEAVSLKLKELGYKPQVGGTTNLDAHDFFLGGTVIKQMNLALRAIVLAQWPPEDEQSPTAPLQFRPNLMFEFGYLAARLRPAFLHLFLIGIKRTDLPSDVLGIRAHEIALASIPAMSETIVNTFLNELQYPHVKPSEVLIKWHYWHQWILSQADLKEPPDHRFAEVIIHAIQPAFYTGDLHKLVDVCKQMERTWSTPDVDVARRLVSAIGKYNTVADSEDPTKIPLGELRSIANSLSVGTELDTSTNAAYWWFEVLRTDYLALTELLLFLGQGLKSKANNHNEHIVRAEQSISASFDALQRSPEAKSGDDPMYLLWCGYIMRNWGRILKESGNTNLAIEKITKAINYRERAAAALSADDIERGIQLQLEIEILLAKLDLAELSPNDMSKVLPNVIKQLLEKQEAWVGLWFRAFTHTEKLARRYRQPSAELLKKRLHTAGKMKS